MQHLGGGVGRGAVGCSGGVLGFGCGPGSAWWMLREWWGCRLGRAVAGWLRSAARLPWGWNAGVVAVGGAAGWARRFVMCCGLSCGAAPRSARLLGLPAWRQTGAVWLKEAGGVRPCVTHPELEATITVGSGELLFTDRCRIEDLVKIGYQPAKIAMCWAGLGPRSPVRSTAAVATAAVIGR